MIPALHQLVPQHLGQLHPYETLLVLLLAFGPFVVIVLLVLRDRRRSTGEDESSIDVAEDEPTDGP